MTTLTLDERLLRAEQVLTRVAQGELDSRIDTGELDEHPMTNLEMGINFLIMDLRASAEENRRHTTALATKQRELEEQLQVIAQQSEAIAELSTPVIEVWRDVLVLPLIGVLDSSRSAQVMETLLTRVVASRARCVIVDVTGVAVMDTATADYLMRIVKAVTLLGARGVLTGIGPAVARTLVAFDLGLSGIRTLRTLRAGLEDCIAFLNRADASDSLG